MRRALDRHRGNLTAAANQLGIAKHTLYEKIRKYDPLRAVSDTRRRGEGGRGVRVERARTARTAKPRASPRLRAATARPRSSPHGGDERIARAGGRARRPRVRAM
ncbi:helix-turn-helix domain-containing protein [Burkholderia pseudomallei]|uniref:helix-turn-helix domain-containing protein n=1 Tax=Burkholderia pseudomallei TaxID=28450 RepID=UPI00217549D0|nr:helix-turn-helix domain-containing protein [Burkholderia pseudomallei]